VHEIDAGHHLEHLAGELVARANPAGPHVDLAGMGLGIGDELRDRVHWQRRSHLQHKGVERDARDGCAVAEEVELEIVVERRIAGICKTSR